MRCLRTALVRPSLVRQLRTLPYQPPSSLSAQFGSPGPDFTRQGCHHRYCRRPGCSRMVYSPTGSKLSLASTRVMISPNRLVSLVSIAGMV